MRALSDRFTRLNAWLERYLDLDQGLHWMGHHVRAVSLALLTLLLLAWGASGFTQIGPDEIGLARRFGRLLPEDLTPGLHYRWPWPIDDVTRVNPAQVRTLEIGFRSDGSAGPLAGPRAWSSPHGGDGIRRLADEAVLITGDGNLLEVQATIRYTIAQPRTFLFEVREPTAVLRSAAEAALREVAAARTFTELLTSGRETFQTEVLARLEQRWGQYGANGLGLRLEGLALHDLHPPQEVVESYHEVTKAMEARDRRVNLAQASALGRERQQEGESLRTVRQAEASAVEKLRLAEAQRDAFLARHRARTALSLGQEFDLLLSSLRSGRPTEDAVRDYQKRRADAMAQQAAVNDFRHFWDALAGALAGREKVVIDADKVPGRRNLWLLPLDLLRPPTLPAPERSGRSLRRGEIEEP
jgi:regulator of protease activity HflC (stomatin/prohibitin superfamily)